MKISKKNSTGVLATVLVSKTPIFTLSFGNFLMPGEFHPENENVNHRKKITKKLEKISTQNKRMQIVRLFKKA